MPIQLPKERLTVRIPPAVLQKLQAIADLTGVQLATLAAEKLTYAVMQEEQTDLQEELAELRDEIDELRTKLAHQEKRLAARKRKQTGPKAPANGQPPTEKKQSTSALAEFFNNFVAEDVLERRDD